MRSCALGLIVSASALATPACGTLLTVEDDATSPDAARPPDLADLRIDVAASPLSPSRDDEVLLRVRVRNSGPGPAASVVVTVPLALAKLRLPIEPPANWTCTAPETGSTGEVICRTSSFSTANDSAVIPITLTWQEGAPKSMRVQVKSDTPDPQSNNNMAAPQASLP